MKQYELTHCTSALERIKAGKSSYNPLTNKNDLSSVMDITAKFVSVQDQIDMSITSVDDLHPILSDLLSALLAFKTVDNDSTAIKAIQNWENKLRGLGASYKLTDDEARDLKHELSKSFSEIKKQLEF